MKQAIINLKADKFSALKSFNAILIIGNAEAHKNIVSMKAKHTFIFV